MSAKTIDVLIFIPLIPAIPVIATWPLPWEDWIPRRVPRRILGPYLLYCSFALWHFTAPSWVVMLVAAFGIVVSGMAISDVRKARRLKRAKDWPVVEGSVLHIGESRDVNKALNVTLTYTYRVEGELYGGSESFVFPKDEDAERFKAGIGSVVKVHYRPGEPEDSVVLR